MRKFNLQVAMQKGATDTQGNKVQHLTHLIQGDKQWNVFKATAGHRMDILFFVDETGQAFNLDGTPAPQLDLSTEPVKRQIWLNIYFIPPRNSIESIHHFGYFIEPNEYPSEEAALKGNSGYIPVVESTYIRPVCVREWEE